MGNWQVIQDGENIHVMPMYDLKKHELAPDCHCKPTLDQETWEIYGLCNWTHNSYDKREMFEEDHSNNGRLLN